MDPAILSLCQNTFLLAAHSALRRLVPFKMSVFLLLLLHDESAPLAVPELVTLCVEDVEGRVALIMHDREAEVTSDKQTLIVFSLIKADSTSPVASVQIIENHDLRVLSLETLCKFLCLQELSLLTEWFFSDFQDLPFF